MNFQKDFSNTSREEIEDLVFFPINIAHKYNANDFFKIWKHLLGFHKLDKKDFKILESRGLAKKYKLSEEEIVYILKNKSPQKLNQKNINNFDICDWCKSETYILHDHHYPIPKKKGGKEIVEICANCHYEFHSLEGKWQYKPSDEIISGFEDSENKKIQLLKEFDLWEASK